MSPGACAQVAGLMVDATGWLTPHADIARTPSPNFDARPDDMPVELIVLHNISLPPGRFGGTAISDFFANRLDPNADPYFSTIADLRVSAHFLVERTGRVVQFVSCLDRAWHAGVSEFQGRARCNDFSIGIEIEGADDQPYDDRQYPSIAAVIAALRAAFPVRALVGHSDIAPTRKTDPGPCFDWSRLARLAQMPPEMFPCGLHAR